LIVKVRVDRKDLPAANLYNMPMTMLFDLVREWVTFCQNICQLFRAVGTNHFEGAAS
jgi:hypothetical protein